MFLLYVSPPFFLSILQPFLAHSPLPSRDYAFPLQELHVMHNSRSIRAQHFCINSAKSWYLHVPPCLSVTHFNLLSSFELLLLRGSCLWHVHAFFFFFYDELPHCDISLLIHYLKFFSDGVFSSHSHSLTCIAVLKYFSVWKELIALGKNTVHGMPRLEFSPFHSCLCMETLGKENCSKEA